MHHRLELRHAAAAARHSSRLQAHSGKDLRSGRLCGARRPADGAARSLRTQGGLAGRRHSQEGERAGVHPPCHHRDSAGAQGILADFHELREQQPGISADRRGSLGVIPASRPVFARGHSGYRSSNRRIGGRNRRPNLIDCLASEATACPSVHHAKRNLLCTTAILNRIDGSSWHFCDLQDWHWCVRILLDSGN